MHLGTLRQHLSILSSEITNKELKNVKNVALNLKRTLVDSMRTETKDNHLVQSHLGTFMSDDSHFLPLGGTSMNDQESAMSVDLGYKYIFGVDVSYFSDYVMHWTIRHT